MVLMMSLVIGAPAADAPTKQECRSIGHLGRPVAEAWFSRPNVDPWPGLTIGSDTAAWTRLIRMLEVGRLPPPGAVRAEELIQALPSEEPPPLGDRAFALRAEVARSPWEHNAAMVRVTITGRRPSFLDRPPAHVVLVIDEMVQDHEVVVVAREGVKALVTGLRHDDVVTVIGSSRPDQALLPPTPADHIDAVVGALDHLRSVPEADLPGALVAGWDLLSAAPSDVLRRLVVVSDGDLDLVVADDQLMRRAAAEASDGIGMVGLGFGERHARDDSVEAIVQAAGGSTLHLSYPFDGEVLADHIGPLLEPAARDVRMLVEWDPQRVLSVHRVGNHHDRVAGLGPSNTSVGGELGVGQTATVIYEVRLNPTSGERSLGEVSVVATPPGEGPHSLVVELPATPLPFARASDDRRLAVAASSLAELLAGQQPLSRVPPERVVDVARLAARDEYARDQQLVTLAERSVELLRRRQQCHEQRDVWF